MAVSRASSADCFPVSRTSSAGCLPVSRTSSAGSLPASTNSEHTAMRRCYDKMVDILKSGIDRLGDTLFAKGIIPSDIKDKLLATPLPDYKARLVLNCVLDRVKHDPQMFHDFLLLLKEQGEWTAIVVKCLESSLDSATANYSLSLTNSQSKLTLAPLETDELEMAKSRTLSEADEMNSSMTESPLKVEKGHVQTHSTADSDSQSSMDSNPLYTHTRDILLLMSKMAPTQNPMIVPRRKRAPLTKEEKQGLYEQGIHEDCCQNDLSIVTTRYAVDTHCAIRDVITGEKTTCERVREQIADLFDSPDTNKRESSVVLHYIGPGQRKTGNWCFKDGFISFDKIIELYTRSKSSRRRALTIVSDCSYSGRWVKEAMAFMDRQGVGPCGHKAMQKGILVNIYASSLSNEIPAELAFSTYCVQNDYCRIIAYTTDFRGKQIHDNQHPSGIDFTKIRCKNTINKLCTMAPSCTWDQYSAEQRIRIVTGKYESKPAWHYIMLTDDEDIIKAHNNKQDGETMNVQEYGDILKSGWGKNPSREIRKSIKDQYHVNYDHFV